MPSPKLTDRAQRPRWEQIFFTGLWPFPSKNIRVGSQTRGGPRKSIFYSNRAGLQKLLSIYRNVYVEFIFQNNNKIHFLKNIKIVKYPQKVSVVGSEITKLIPAYSPTLIQQYGKFWPDDKTGTLASCEDASAQDPCQGQMCLALTYLQPTRLIILRTRIDS